VNTTPLVCLPIQLDFRLRLQGFVLDLHVQIDVQAAALVGPPGSGKSMTLQVIAGLKKPDCGFIRIADRVLFDSQRGINVRVCDRRVAYVPQQDVGLFPHLDVRQNVIYGARQAHQRSLERGCGFDRVAQMLGILPILGHRVSELTAGERQRVALARAIVSNPDLLLFDEPLVGLDRLRTPLMPYLQRVRNETSVTLIYVTHNRAEAQALAELVIVLNGGNVERLGPPDILGTSPIRSKTGQSHCLDCRKPDLG
jgi:molybdate transport system ATP-binding protein